MRSPEREGRKQLGRTPGKRKGAPGHHLAMTSLPDRIVELLRAVCDTCDPELSGLPKSSVDANRNTIRDAIGRYMSWFGESRD